MKDKLLILLIILLLVNCSEKQNETRKLSQTITQKNVVDSILIKSNEISDSDTIRKVKSITKYKRSNFVEYFKLSQIIICNKDGLLESQSYYDPHGKLMLRESFFYDENNRKVAELTWNYFKGKRFHKRKFIYNNRNKIVQCIYFSESDKPYSKEYFYYNSFDSIETVVNDWESIKEITKHFYNTKRQKYLTIYQDITQHTNKMLYDYDKNGNVIHDRYVQSNNIIHDSYTKFDSFKRTIEKINLYTNSGESSPDTISHIHWEYKDNKLSHEYWKLRDGTNDIKYEYSGKYLIYEKEEKSDIYRGLLREETKYFYEFY